jgi:hypothetical protein
MSGPFQMVGEQDAPVCADGVCELPAPEAAQAQESDEARGARGERR